MCSSNLVVILPTGHLDHVPSTHRSQHKVLNTWPIYTRDQLFEFKNKLKLDNRYSILHYETINRVRDLKINKRPKKQDTRKLEKRIVNMKNLVRLRNNPNSSNNIRIGTVNTRWIRSKTQLVLENSRLENLDFLVITETWLTNTDEDQQWLKTSELDNSDYRIEVQNRTNKKGGGQAYSTRNTTDQLDN